MLHVNIFSVWLESSDFDDGYDDGVREVPEAKWS